MKKYARKFEYPGSVVLTPENMEPLLVFGYGSLMNKKTLGSIATDVHKAIIMGYKRTWAPTSSNAYQNIIYTGDNKDILLGCVINITTPGGASALKSREAAYREEKIEIFHVHPDNRSNKGKVFIISEEVRLFERVISPCKMSYVLTCAQGIVDLYGENALITYFDETVGWPPIVDDRKAPSYPRASYTDEVQEEAISIIRSGKFVIAGPKLDNKVIPINEVKGNLLESKYPLYYGGCYESWWEKQALGDTQNTNGAKIKYKQMLKLKNTEFYTRVEK